MSRINAWNVCKSILMDVFAFMCLLMSYHSRRIYLYKLFVIYTRILKKERIFMNSHLPVTNSFALFPDHCSSGGDAKKREGVRRSPEETRPHPTAAIQVPAQRTARRPELSTSRLIGRDIRRIMIVTDDWLLLICRARDVTRHWLCNCQVTCWS